MLTNYNTMYTAQSRKTIYLLIKGAGLLEDLESQSNKTRPTLSNIFLKYKDEQSSDVVDLAVELLRDGGILQDIEKINAILN